MQGIDWSTLVTGELEVQGRADVVGDHVPQVGVVDGGAEQEQGAAGVVEGLPPLLDAGRTARTMSAWGAGAG